jgi:hypothetical protein
MIMVGYNVKLGLCGACFEHPSADRPSHYVSLDVLVAKHTARINLFYDPDKIVKSWI